MKKNSDSQENASGVGRREFIKLGASAGAVIMAGLSPSDTAAQNPSGKPVSIDLHTHWIPREYAKAVAELGHPANNASNPLTFDLEQRVKWMDEHDVQIHVLTLDGGMPWWWVRPDEGAHIAQIVNDAAVEAHKEYPNRFYGAVEMSIRDPQLALKEVNRMAGKPGIKAVHLPNSMENDDYIFQPEYEPLLERCQELGYPLLFHPLDGDVNVYGGKRIDDKLSLAANLNNTLGFPFESATTAAKFITTGALDKFPKLEILLPHSGGCFPYIAGRVEHGITRKKFKVQRPFREYIRRFHYDSIAYYPETLRFLITLAGSDRVVIGTDNYAIMDVEQPNALVEELKLPAEDTQRILRGNAAKLLKI
jgi:aminocarboxymuconate-semialdehyde decarboxylase